MSVFIEVRGQQYQKSQGTGNSMHHQETNDNMKPLNLQNEKRKRKYVAELGRLECKKLYILFGWNSGFVFYQR